MRVFITGATGFIGSAVVEELLCAGHEVLGLARSPVAARVLAIAGAQVLRGDIEDRDSLRRGAERADGVIHAAVPRHITSGQAAAASERTAVRSLAAALAGSNCPLLVTSAITGLRPGGLASEQDHLPPSCNQPHATSEQAADAVATWGVRVAVVRLPPVVYDAGQEGKLRTLLWMAQATDTVAYPRWGDQRWAAVHRLDVARLYRLALEQAPAPGTRLHAVAEEGVPIRKVAAALRHQLELPNTSLVEKTSITTIGQLADLGEIDIRATSQQTQLQLGWQLQQVDLLAYLDSGDCSASEGTIRW